MRRATPPFAWVSDSHPSARYITERAVGVADAIATLDSFWCYNIGEESKKALE